MITLNGNTYKLCLIDTNVVSEMMKRPNPLMRHFFERMPPSEYIPCFSLFTILELRERDDVYQRFLEMFSKFPCCILKNLDLLFKDELAAYPDPSEVSPILIASPGGLVPKNKNLAEILNQAFGTPDIQANADRWNAGKNEIVEGIVSLVKNYPPKSEKYTTKEIKGFVEIAGFQQIAMRAFDFAQKIVQQGQAVSVDAFRSIKMTAFIVFYKFYPDKRRPIDSDAFDIIIASVLPYVDTVITEKHQAEIFRKIQKLDKLIENLEIFTLKDVEGIS